MKSHIFTEQRKTVQIPSVDLLKAVGVDPNEYEVVQASSYSGGYSQSEVAPIIELSLREKVKREAGK